MRLWILVFVAGTMLAQPKLATRVREGVVRADLRHAGTGESVTDENPVVPGEWLEAAVSGVGHGARVLVNRETVAGSIEPNGLLEFRMPNSISGSFVEISVEWNNRRSNAASTSVAGPEDPSQLTLDDVRGLVTRAAQALDDPHMAIAVTDRLGRPLATYTKPLATDADVEIALSLARTGAFFSNDQAPLSSRTVATISRDHFPNDVPNRPAAALFGIEHTNRGCSLNTLFEPGKQIPPATALKGTGPGDGITTMPGGLPLYKNGRHVVGGLGVAGVDPNAAEYANVAATFNTTFFVPLPLPPPQAVFIDGVRLPFVSQTTPPAGMGPASSPGGTYQIPPRAGSAAPDGYLVAPQAGAALSAGDVYAIIQRCVARGNKTRAVIRLPLGSRARFVIAVTDLDGSILGLYRMPDSTIFSIDVAVAKARNVVYFSGPHANPNDLKGVPPATAVTNRTIGFGAQPFFPPGIDNSGPGPFLELFTYDLKNPCTQGRQPKNTNQSGVVFFPGSAPLYRNGVLIGGLGVSGDGVEQDDYDTAAGAQGFEPLPQIRADQVFIEGIRLPYWKFPRNPEQ